MRSRSHGDNVSFKTFQQDNVIKRSNPFFLDDHFPKDIFSHSHLFDEGFRKISVSFLFSTFFFSCFNLMHFMVIYVKRHFPPRRGGENSIRLNEFFKGYLTYRSSIRRHN